MHSMVLPLLRHSATEREASLVRVVSLSGFGRRDADDGAVVDHDGVHGDVLGGILDPLIREAFATGEGSRLVTGRVTDPDADAAGLLCGGTARLLLTPLDEIPALFRASVESANPVALVTRLSPAGSISATMVVTRQEAAGSLSAAGEIDDDLVDMARNQLAAGRSDAVVIDVAGDELAIATLIPRPKGHVVGSGPVADAIVAQGELMGWSMSADKSTTAGERFIAEAGPADAIVILSHDPRVDTPLLDAALRSEIGYLGAMGSRHTQEKRRSRLEALGHSPDSFGRIHGPVGLDLGSRTPAETAVAIVAEYLVNRSGRVPQPLGVTDGPING